MTRKGAKMAKQGLALRLKDHLPDFTGHAALYELDPPLEAASWDDDETAATHKFVIVSATNAMFTGSETYIFPATPDGQITDYGELPGSMRGTLSHAEALREAGYEIGGHVED